ncbi:hypothetical protein V6N11_033850 [Hibiscus sabdariffa]|uniref:Uncharacterized protein n=1 Tax=Hibiscus sabdariffa TaxID=183260 RepID=A0ABR2S1A1_9ROSI
MFQDSSQHVFRYFLKGSSLNGTKLRDLLSEQKISSGVFNCLKAWPYRDIDDLARALLGEIEKDTKILMFYFDCPRRPWSSVRATSRLTKDFSPSSYVLRSESSDKEVDEGHNVENDRVGLENSLNNAISEVARI